MENNELNWSGLTKILANLATELDQKDENLRRICINTRKAYNTKAYKPCDEGSKVNGHENKDPRIWLLIEKFNLKI